MDGELHARTVPAALTAALEEAHVPTLVMVLVHLTGDKGWLDGERPVYVPFDDGQGGLSPAFVSKVKAAAAAALEEWRQNRLTPTKPDQATVRRMMDYIAGAEIPSHYAPFLSEELGLEGEDPKRPRWDKEPLAAAAPRLSAVIIGAGMSGLLAAIRLQQAGIKFTLVEKNADVGGTWLENLYPGVRVDTPNHLYSYSFEPNHAWPQRYSTGDVLLEYFRRTADKYGLRDKTLFSTTVKRCVFHAQTGVWETIVIDADGAERALESTVVITAVGQLNQPRMPSIEGTESFKGEAFHSARWPADFTAAGKRVAVIGAGASAFQFVPEIAKEASSLTVFQRSAPWLAPTADYHEPVGEGKKALLEHLPFYDKWYRFYLFWTMTDGVYEAVKADPDWSGGPEAVGALNAGLGAMLAQAIAPQTEGRPDLLKKVVPNYPFGGKRALRDNGTWIQALRRDTVSLETTPIARITPEGILTMDGVLHHADVIVYGTGFEASSFLKGVEIVGADGRSLHETWAGDARAYLGITVPGFPNFFSLYGPNTNIVVNGSIIFFSECAVRYVMGCLELLARTGADRLEVKSEVHDAFNAKVDEANAKMAWGAPQVSSWYKNALGRVSQNWPFPLVDYWSATLAPNPDDFILRAPGQNGA